MRYLIILFPVYRNSNALIFYAEVSEARWSYYSYLLSIYPVKFLDSDRSYEYICFEMMNIYLYFVFGHHIL